MKSRLAQCKHLFFRLSFREKLLLVLFIACGLFIWAGNTLGGLRDTLQQLRSTSTALQDQEFWLGKEKEINSRMAAVLAQLQSDRTFTSAQLVGRIDNIARQGEDLSYEIFSPRTESDAELNLHSLRFRVRRAGLADLLALHERLVQEEPYISLENLRITANRQNPEQLDASFIVSSPELKSDAIY